MIKLFSLISKVVIALLLPVLLNPVKTTTTKLLLKIYNY